MSYIVKNSITDKKSKVLPKQSYETMVMKNSQLTELEKECLHPLAYSLDHGSFTSSILRNRLYNPVTCKMYQGDIPCFEQPPSKKDPRTVSTARFTLNVPSNVSPYNEKEIIVTFEDKPGGKQGVLDSNEEIHYVDLEFVTRRNIGTLDDPVYDQKTLQANLNNDLDVQTKKTPEIKKTLQHVFDMRRNSPDIVPPVTQGVTASKSFVTVLHKLIQAATQRSSSDDSQELDREYRENPGCRLDTNGRCIKKR